MAWSSLGILGSVDIFCIVAQCSSLISILIFIVAMVDEAERHVASEPESLLARSCRRRLARAHVIFRLLHKANNIEEH